MLELATGTSSKTSSKIQGRTIFIYVDISWMLSDYLSWLDRSKWI